MAPPSVSPSLVMVVVVVVVVGALVLLVVVVLPPPPSCTRDRASTVVWWSLVMVWWGWRSPVPVACSSCVPLQPVEKIVNCGVGGGCFFFQLKLNFNYILQRTIKT